MAKKKKIYHKFSLRKFLNIFVILGIVLLIVPIIWNRPDYEELISKQICVDSVGTEESVHFLPRSSGRWQISDDTDYILTTTDGEKFDISGEFAFEELQEKLVAETVAEIKYHKGLDGFKRTQFIMELHCDGAKLVSYDGDQQSRNLTFIIIIGIFSILLGGFLYCWTGGVFSHLKMKRKKRKRQEQNGVKGN